MNHSNSIPSIVHIKLTNACNLSCQMCGQVPLRSENGHCELSYNKTLSFFESIVDELKYVYIWGGEPTLAHHFQDFISFFSRAKYLAINTNGVLLHKHIDFLINHKVDLVFISIDGIGDINDCIRGVKGVFNIIENNLQILINKRKGSNFKPQIHIIFTITPQNQSNIKKFVKRYIHSGVNKIIIQLPTYTTLESCNAYEHSLSKILKVKNNHSTARGFILDLNSYNTKEIFNQIEFIRNEYPSFVQLTQNYLSTWKDYDDYFTNYLNNFNCNFCQFIESGLVLEPNGNIVICPDFTDIKIGNLYVDNIFSIMSKKKTLFNNINFNEEAVFPICNRCCQLKNIL